jgi:hypothetical protein
MVVAIENPETFEKLKALSLARLQKEIKEKMVKYLEEQFEKSNVNSSAIAVVEAAEQMGLTDLSEKLNSKLNQSIENLNN